jgi:amino acid adenylation domain-containing protein
VTATLLRALAQYARTTPDHTALVARDDRMSYAQLYDAARRVAAALQQVGVGRGDRVGIHGEKTIATVVSILGTLVSGAAYVPLDPSAPAQRRRGLVEDADLRIVLAQPGKAGELGSVTMVDPYDCAHPEDWREPAIEPEALAYVLYTSGTTGHPKGVCIPHRALDAFFEAVAGLMDIGPLARCLNTSALHFDVSVIDLLFPLSRGATVYIGPSMPLPAQLLGLIECERITHMAAVGSTLTLLAQYGNGLAGRDLRSLRRIMTGAEVLKPATVQAWLAAAENVAVINGYGPTEATCVVIAELISAREPDRTALYPIGRPLTGVVVRFLAESGEVTEDGPGEILLAGPQVMTGYLGRPEEQVQAFHDGCYRTGDIGHRDGDGAIHFAGRSDDEVKIRGYRINLNEVRRAVEMSPAVDRAFVTGTTDPRSGRALICGVRLREGIRATEDELVAHIGELLPRYMVPRTFVFLTEFPVLSSGKPDTARLRALVEAGW